MRKTTVTAACPHCFRVIIAAIDRYGDNQPKTGDYGVCFACGNTVVFDFAQDRNVIRRPTKAEWAKIERHDGHKAIRGHYGA